METFKIILGITNIVFLAYSLLYTLFLGSSVVVGSVRLYKGKRRRRYNDYYLDEVHLPISIIVPAYNEEVTIVDAINSLLKLDYSTYEIVIVDDGSKDNTSGILIKAFHMQKLDIPIQTLVPSAPYEYAYKTYACKVPITLVRKKNGGSKADANNMGINASSYPYFLCMDADSLLQGDSLREIAIPVLENEDTVAVGGSIRILNDTKIRDGKIVDYRLPKNVLAAFQSMEYDRSFLLARLFYDEINGSIIVSGAFGLFRKDVVVGAGGYDSASFGEDMDLIMHLHEHCTDEKIPYRVAYAPNAACWTQAPETFADLRSQRNRWHLGLRQNLKKYKKMFLHPKYKTVGMFTMPSFVLFESLSPLVEVLGILSIILSLSLGVSDALTSLYLLAIYAAFGVLLSLVSYLSRSFTLDLKITWKEFFRIFFLCLFELFFLHGYFLVIRLMASFKSTKKKLVWKSLARTKNR